jgi:hypothetical protein
MSMRTTLSGAVAIGMAMALGAAVPPSARAAVPVPSNEVTLLAGGASWLVYGVTPTAAAPGVRDVQPTTVYARSTTGKTVTLTTVANINVGQGWSLNSGIVTTVKESSSNARQHVQWWNLSTGKKGVHHLSRSHRWAGSARGGWLIRTDQTGYLGIQSATTLKLTSLHNPYGVRTGGLIKGPNGAVVNKTDKHLNPSHDFVYLRWAHPTKPVRLHSTANICFAVTSKSAFCQHSATDDNDDEVGDALSVQVMPLSGAKPITPKPFHQPLQKVATSTSAVTFELLGDTTTAYFLSPTGHYTSEPIGTGYPVSTISAYGSALYTPADDETTVYSISNAAHSPVRMFGAG